MSGIRRTGDTSTYTRQELLDGIQTFIVEEGRLPTSRDADTGWHGLPSVAAFKREFGSWREAMQAFGMPADPRGGHNKGPSKHKAKAKKTKSRLRSTKAKAD